MSFLNQNNKRAFILAMFALSFIVIVFSYFYYKRINTAKDPRVKEARLLYEKYNKYAVEGNYVNIFNLLDSVEHYYRQFDHYEESFEVGVLYNNRSAAFLTMALHDIKPKNFQNYSKDTLLHLSKLNVLTSIDLYEKWLTDFETLTEDEIKSKIEFTFLKGLDKFSESEQQKFLKNRIEEIMTAQLETQRRLSVSYTNLGIINRHENNYKEAIQNYQKAIEIWSENLTAENNLNILLGKPLKKRNIIQKLFPPDKKKE